MNTHPTSILFAGRELSVTLRDDSRLIVRVREMPARHHLELLELFHVGREAELIQRCTERAQRDDQGAFTWHPVDAAFVDNLTDESHVALSDLAQALNFSRAITTAQRQIARGQHLRPLMESIAKTMLEPMRQELASWTSSLTSQLSAALAAKQP